MSSSFKAFMAAHSFDAHNDQQDKISNVILQDLVKFQQESVINV